MIAAVAAGRLASLQLSEDCTFEPWQYDALAAACATDAARGALDLIDADGRGLELRPAELKAKTDVTYLQQELAGSGAASSRGLGTLPKLGSVKSCCQQNWRGDRACARAGRVALRALAC